MTRTAQFGAHGAFLVESGKTAAESAGIIVGGDAWRTTPSAFRAHASLDAWNEARKARRST